MILRTVVLAKLNATVVENQGTLTLFAALAERLQAETEAIDVVTAERNAATLHQNHVAAELITESSDSDSDLQINPFFVLGARSSKPIEVQNCR